MLMTIAALRITFFGLPASTGLLCLVSRRPIVALASAPFALAGWVVSSRLIDLVYLSIGESVREADRPTPVRQRVERDFQSDDEL